MSKKNRRFARNLLINPKAQFRYGTSFMAVSIVVHAVTTLLVVQIYSLFTSQAADARGLSLPVLAGIILFIYLALYGFSFALGLLISHRLYGPLVSINKGMEKLKAGDYSSRIHLRKNDDEKLKELADAINALAERLQKKT